jgi:hypothetical protein
MAGGMWVAGRPWADVSEEGTRSQCAAVREAGDKQGGGAAGRRGSNSVTSAPRGTGLKPIALPYEFDTSGVVKLILRGALGLLVVVLLGIFYSLLISHSTAAAIQLLLILAIATYLGSLFLRNLPGSVGTITADAVVVQPGRLFGIRLASPAGRFPISQFQAVRVERVPNPIGIPIETQIRPHERVYLVGKNGTLDILVARTHHDAGREVGNELANVLRLQYQEQLVPY